MDKILLCRQCGCEFVFADDEQRFYAEKGYINEPRRCSACRGSAKAVECAVRPAKEMYGAVCAECGKETQIPFRPKGDKPVYCKACFTARKSM